MTFEAVWYNGWIDPPAYILLDEVEGDTPQQALLDNLERLTQQVRDICAMSKDDWDDYKVQETLYLLNGDEKVSTYTLERDGLFHGE